MISIGRLIVAGGYLAAPVAIPSLPAWDRDLPVVVRAADTQGAAATDLPRLSLVGSVSGPDETIGIFIDLETRKTVRLGIGKREVFIGLRADGERLAMTEQVADLLRPSVGSDVVILRLTPHQQIPDASAGPQRRIAG